MLIGCTIKITYVYLVLLNRGLRDGRHSLIRGVKVASGILRPVNRTQSFFGCCNASSSQRVNKTA